MLAASGCTASSKLTSACGYAPAVCEKRGNDLVALPAQSADPPCTTGMTDANPSAQLGVAGSSLLCSSTDLTALPLIMV